MRHRQLAATTLHGSHPSCRQLAAGGGGAAEKRRWFPQGVVFHSSQRFRSWQPAFAAEISACVSGKCKQIAVGIKKEGQTGQGVWPARPFGCEVLALPALRPLWHSRDSRCEIGCGLETLHEETLKVLRRRRENSVFVACLRQSRTWPSEAAMREVGIADLAVTKSAQLLLTYAADFRLMVSCIT